MSDLHYTASKLDQKQAYWNLRTLMNEMNKFISQGNTGIKYEINRIKNQYSQPIDKIINGKIKKWCKWDFRNPYEEDYENIVKMKKNKTTIKSGNI